MYKHWDLAFGFTNSALICQSKLFFSLYLYIHITSNYEWQQLSYEVPYKITE